MGKKEKEEKGTIDAEELNRIVTRLNDVEKQLSILSTENDTLKQQNAESKQKLESISYTFSLFGEDFSKCFDVWMKVSEKRDIDKRMKEFGIKNITEIDERIKQRKEELSQAKTRNATMEMKNDLLKEIKILNWVKGVKIDE